MKWVFMNRFYLVVLIFCFLPNLLQGEDRAVSPTIQEVNAKHAERLLAQLPQSVEPF